MILAVIVAAAAVTLAGTIAHASLHRDDPPRGEDGDDYAGSAGFKLADTPEAGASSQARET